MSSNPCSDSHLVSAIAAALFTLEWLMNSRATAQFPPCSGDPTRSRDRIHLGRGGDIASVSSSWSGRMRITRCKASLHLDADRPDQFAIFLMVAADAGGE